MSDLISRQAAIDKLNKEYHGMLSDESMKIYQIKNWLSTLPSVEPERKVGHWIEHEWAEESGGYLISNFECDKCHAWAEADYDYCPNCGVKMEVVEE